MTALDEEVLAERVSAVERHLARVSEKLPPTAEAFRPSTDASDAVLLHLWQAVQIVIDLAIALCVRTNLGAPSDYGNAFRKLEAAGIVDQALADRLVAASGFRNVMAHAYESLDMVRIHDAAQNGPAHLRAFLRIVRDVTSAKRGAP